MLLFLCILCANLPLHSKEKELQRITCAQITNICALVVTFQLLCAYRVSASFSDGSDNFFGTRRRILAQRALQILFRSVPAFHSLANGVHSGSVYPSSYEKMEKLCISFAPQELAHRALTCHSLTCSLLNSCACLPSCRRRENSSISSVSSTRTWMGSGLSCTL